MHIHATPFSYTHSGGSWILLVRGVLQLDSTLDTTESVLKSASVKTTLILFLMASPKISWIDFHTCPGRFPRFKVGNPGFKSFDIYTPLISWFCAPIPHMFLCAAARVSSAVPTTSFSASWLSWPHVVNIVPTATFEHPFQINLTADYISNLRWPGQDLPLVSLHQGAGQLGQSTAFSI